MSEWTCGQNWIETWFPEKIKGWDLKKLRASILETYMGLYSETDETRQNACKKALNLDLPEAGLFHTDAKTNTEIAKLIRIKCGIGWNIGSFYAFKEGNKEKEGYCKQFVAFLEVILKMNKEELSGAYKKFALEVNTTQFAGYSLWLDFERDLKDAGYMKYLDEMP